MAIPAKRPMPRSRVKSMAAILFAEPPVDELREGRPGRPLRPGRRSQDDVRALGGGQGEDPQDAFAVDLAPVLDDMDLGPERLAC